MKHTLKHKKLIITLAACAVIMAGIGGTYAVLTASTGEVKNQFKPEVIETDIVEDWSENALDKTVSIKNVGPDDAFIRARVTISPDDVATWERKSSTDGDKNYWEEGENGWYYYKKVVSPGETTAPLMGEVVLKTDSFEGDFDVTVYQEAVGTGDYTSGKVVDDVKNIKKLFDAIQK